MSQAFQNMASIPFLKVPNYGTNKALFLHWSVNALGIAWYLSDFSGKCQVVAASFQVSPRYSLFKCLIQITLWFPWSMETFLALNCPGCFSYILPLAHVCSHWFSWTLSDELLLPLGALQDSAIDQLPVLYDSCIGSVSGCPLHECGTHQTCTGWTYEIRSSGFHNTYPLEGEEFNQITRSVQAWLLAWWNDFPFWGFSQVNGGEWGAHGGRKMRRPCCASKSPCMHVSQQDSLVESSPLHFSFDVRLNNQS